MSKKVCSFIGSGQQDFLFSSQKNNLSCIELKEKLRKEIEKQIIKNKVHHFISGMGLGFDSIAAEIVIDLKSTYPYITLEAAIPYEEQAVNWKEKDRNKYFTIIEQCDKETFVSKRYTADCIHRENQYMVDNSDTIITIGDGISPEMLKMFESLENKEKSIVVIEV